MLNVQACTTLLLRIVVNALCKDSDSAIAAVGQAGGGKIIVAGMMATLALPPCQEQFARLLRGLCSKVTVRSLLLRAKASDVITRSAALHIHHRGASHLLARALKELIG